jgi:hypothetical protein
VDREEGTHTGEKLARERNQSSRQADFVVIIGWGKLFFAFFGASHAKKG